LAEWGGCEIHLHKTEIHPHAFGARRAKFYSLTRAGRKALDEESANWKRLSAAIARVVRLKQA
jgi:DNA-binding MarR family transcriptional regulator